MSTLARCLLILLLTAPFPSLLIAQSWNPGPEAVVVVANRNAPGSLEVARAYQALRQIPDKNIVLLETSTGEGISRTEFQRTLRNPLLKALRERELISALEGRTDAFGRDTVTLIQSRIAYLVLCHGIPARVSGSPGDDLDLRRELLKGPQAHLVAAFSSGRLAKARASVDGELALILRRDMPFNGFVPNPYFNRQQPGPHADILKVTRLDGPSPEAVIRMLQNSIAGERDGLAGRAYVDEDGRGGAYQDGNDWLSGAAEVFRALHFDLEHNRKGGEFGPADRFDAPVLYAGWYSRSINGPFTLPGFRFPPGAVAAHLHSASARPLRSADTGWVGPFVERGVSATFGNVNEPYLRLTHHFDRFFAALADGWNFADAAYAALPGLSWQAVAIGDPLFRPFAVSLETQLERMQDRPSQPGDPYRVLREIEALLDADQPEAALERARSGMSEAPAAALVWKEAELLRETRKKRKARKTLSILAELDPVDASEWGLLARVADTLLELGDRKAALRLYRSLLEQEMPHPVRVAFLKRAIPVARKAGDRALADSWNRATRPPAEPSQPAEPDPQTESSPADETSVSPRP
jgi:uncharacterized protein (TIGR03790 family)